MSVCANTYVPTLTHIYLVLTATNASLTHIPTLIHTFLVLTDTKAFSVIKS